MNTRTHESERPLGRRERRKRETREALLEAAFTLFAERGYHRTTVGEIADAAGVSRRTAFRYFPTKHLLVFPGREGRLERFKKLLHDDPNRRPYEALRHAVLTLAKDYQGDRSHLVAQHALVRATPELAGLELQLDRDFEEAMVERLRAGRRSRVAARRARVIAAAVMGVIRASLREWLDGGGEADLAGLGEEAFRVLEEGVSL